MTEDVNSSLTYNFQAWEVEVAQKQKVPLKATGLDGMPPLFFQNYWDLVKGDITTTVLTYLNSSSLPSPLNRTRLVFAICFTRFFSKDLANKLKRVLPLIISKHQSAFLKGRLITNNILVAFETLHYMKNHNSRNTGFMALKLDMSKAYDRGERSFLRDVMVQMGFNKKWVALIMECITSVSYSLLINGEP